MKLYNCDKFFYKQNNLKMNIKNKIKFYIILLLIIPLVLLFPVNYIYSQEESSDSEIFDTGRLIPFSDCPFDFIINVEDNFTKVEIQHYGQDGSVDKFGGWKAWLEVNGDLVYEWLSWDSEIGAEWYDYTEQSYYYDNESRPDYTDITDYIHPGENIITFYHYTEGPGAGIIVKVYYRAKQEEESYDYEEEDLVLDEGLEEDLYVEEEIPQEYVEEYTDEDSLGGDEVGETSEQKLILKFKSEYIDIDNPKYILGRGIPGITKEKLKEYETSTLGRYILGPGAYVTIANSWEEVARLAVLESKVHYNNSQTLGYFCSLKKILDTFYTILDFKESALDLRKQFNTLKSVKSAKELVKHKETLMSFTSNLSGIYSTMTNVDKQEGAELGLPEIDQKIMFVIGAVSSGGWSVLADISNELYGENAKYSINYEIQKAVLNSSLAYHAQKLHEIALIDKINGEEIEKYYFHVERILALKKIDIYLNAGSAYSTWQDNQDFMTQAFNILNIIDAKDTLQKKLDGYNVTLTNYEYAEEFVRSAMNELQIKLE